MVFRGDSLDAMMARLGFGRYVVKTINDITEVKKLYEQIAAAAREPGDGAGHCSMLVYQYILLMHKLLIVQQENRTGTVVDNAIMYMEKNYRDDISLQTLASVCGISTQHFCRVFHDKIGMRPMEYLAMKRISSAKVALLDTNAPIAQIDPPAALSPFLLPQPVTKLATHNTLNPTANNFFALILIISFSLPSTRSLLTVFSICFFQMCG